ncbi:M23 family metallopeptidase [Streptomyces sp. SP17BM10]|uniref:M23 family metallopeptidase n=1 Tax=Streptomyces sp. SP17BM10 TaxID=3002530 RepID=UPI002E769E80|nr:M23 family metallopeptidase [Streptomyces sp. SP17BM10]MEE1786762.1 M23 family metallopeptidase [Streptomyces sp. SP17BM10]
MSSVPPVGPALRRLAARTAARAAAWQPRLGHAVRTVGSHAAPVLALTESRHPLPGARVWADRERAVIAAGGTAVLLAGALLVAAPGSASAQTVLPTTPGSSAFTAPQATVPAPGMVQVAGPSPYRLPDDSESAQADVATAPNLLPVEPPAEPAPAAPAPGGEEAAAPVPAPAAAPDWSAPVPGAPTSNPYGVPNSEYAAGYHTGVDFAVGPGTPLLAVGNATVVSAGWDGSYGKEVVLRLADGHFAQYAHLSSVEVSPGRQVSAAEEIGRSGSTGNSTGPHLHFEIRTSNRYGAVINPIAYLSAHGVTAF